MAILKKWVSGISIESCVDNADAIILMLAKQRELLVAGGRVGNLAYEEAFADPTRIPDFAHAVRRVLLAKEKNERVAIFGDYDVDGITSTAILAETLEKIGIIPTVFLPHREDDGYGLNIAAVEKIAAVADLLITIDNGSSAHQAIEKAVEKGLNVLVIDHHVVPETLPKALVVNPHRVDNEYPFVDFCAAGLAFIFARALLAEFDREDEAKWLMDLAALGTIADRVSMTGENREIVKFGLKVLAVTRRLGLIALMARSGVVRKEADVENIAFKIIPRLNAAGRMQHADLAYALIRTKDHLEAEKLTLELDALNNSRREITKNATKEIKQILDNEKTLPDVLFLSGSWPIGILGILAGKIADEYQRPAAVVNIGETDCTGSIRGNGLVDIVEILAGAKHLLTKYGGHFTAGGFSFAKNDLLVVKEYFASLSIANKTANEEVFFDLELHPSLISHELVDALRVLEPHGENNLKPVFLIKELEIREVREMGSAREHKKFIFYHPQFGNGTLAGVAFYWKHDKPFLVGNKADILCELKTNEFRGNVSIDLMIVDIRPSSH